MKAQEFKKLMTLIVKEAVREELKSLKKELINELKNPNNNKPNLKSSSPVIKSNSINSLLEETKRNMSQNDYQTIANFNTNNLQGFNPFEGINAGELNSMESMMDPNEIPSHAIPDFSNLMNELEKKGKL